MSLFTTDKDNHHSLISKAEGKKHKNHQNKVSTMDYGSSSFSTKSNSDSEDMMMTEELLPHFRDDKTKADKKGKKWFNTSFKKYLYPPDIPDAVQLLRLENIAVPCSYLIVGLLQGLSGPLINVYPLDLGATEAQQTTISSLQSIPACFKILFGFLSDNAPIMGYRRKSYMFLGWLITSLSMWTLISFSDLRLDTTIKDGIEIRTPANGAPSIPFLSLSVFLFGMGYWSADVMGDSIVAEKAKLEPEHCRGQLQSTCYACRFFGLMIAAPISTVVYSKFGPGFVIMTMALLPGLMLPMIWSFSEQTNIPIKSTKEQCNEIWNTVCSRAVWQPLGFCYIYNVLQVGNSAWTQYLSSVLGFTANQLNSLLIAVYVLLYVGIMAYKYYFIRYSWRTVYFVATLVNGFFSALQVLLIQGITFGLGSFWFALGDNALAELVIGIQFLPTTIMMVHLCPSGSEGASYAMFTTVYDSAINLASALSTMLLGIWDVSKETMISGDLSGMTKLTILTSVLQVSGLLFIKLLPGTKEDLERLHVDEYSGNKLGGSIFLAITFFSVAYAIVVGIMNVIEPGWMGES